MLRPEFPASRDHEHETLQLVKDVADTFDQISAGPTHTASLYSVFLRALLASKTEPPSEAASDSGDNDTMPHVNGNPDQRQVGTAESYPHHMLSEFQFASEMGPVTDMTTFPPTMATTHPTDSLGLLSMDSILSGGFWDNMLVPGRFVVSSPNGEANITIQVTLTLWKGSVGALYMARVAAALSPLNMATRTQCPL